MNELITIFTSNIPVDCHILKGRLDSEGIPCYIFDENIISVDPFRAVSVWGVKLKVPEVKFKDAKKIMDLLEEGKLLDEKGEYGLGEIFSNEIHRQEDILRIKNSIRIDPTLLDTPSRIDGKSLGKEDFGELIKQEQEFFKLSQKQLLFSWKQFFYELFEFDRSVFKYLRPKPNEFYLEKDIVDSYISPPEGDEDLNCPDCHSDNVAFGLAIDYKWDIIYLLVSVILLTPLFLIRAKYHCFNCGLNFNRKAKSKPGNQGVSAGNSENSEK